ncbi:KR domain-containing protein, partial [Bacillus wiedmannii]|uniref:KR domain-containing protein n=1 Tax=Bacillus wiedmannii TaxID=1890302 RepID=UPI000BFAB67F
GTIHGVIHAAGRPDSNAQTTINETGETEISWHFIPKIRGLYVLEKILGKFELDFLLLTSSLSPILGGLAHVAYASSNAFLDTYAGMKNQMGSKSYPVLGINWEAWHNHEEVFERYGIGQTLSKFFITPEEGVKILHRILCNSNLEQVIVSTGDLYSRLEQWVSVKKAFNANQKREITKLKVRPRMKTIYVKPRNQIEELVCNIWMEILGIEEIGIHDNFFFDLGGHSLLGTQVISRLRESFPIDIPLRCLFEAPTVEQLCDWIICELAQYIDSEQLAELK